MMAGDFGMMQMTLNKLKNKLDHFGPKGCIAVCDEWINQIRASSYIRCVCL